MSIERHEEQSIVAQQTPMGLIKIVFEIYIVEFARASPDIRLADRSVRFEYYSSQIICVIMYNFEGVEQDD